MRVKLPLPPSDMPPLHQSNYTLGVADMNYGNHLGNDRVLTLAHEARLRYLRELGYDELNFYDSALIMTDAMVQYKGQGFMGDAITFKVWLLEPTAIGFFVLIHKLDQPKEEIARIKTAMLFFDYEKMKRAKASLAFKEKFLP